MTSKPNILYFVNQYPKVSHTFIRREIIALENLGATVIRSAARSGPEQLIDSADIQEHSRTLYIVEGQKLQLLIDTTVVFFRNPIKFFNTLALALQLSFSANFKVLRYLAYFAEACSLLNIAKKHNIEHIHSHFGTNSTTVAMITRWLDGPKYSFTLHGPEEFDHPIALSLGKKIEDADFVVAITSYCRSQLFRWCSHRYWSKIKEIHCTVEPDFINLAVAPPKSTKKFLTIGRLSEQKGQMLLLQAINTLKERNINIELDIIGDGELREQIETYIQIHQLEDRVKLLGWKSSEDIASALDSCSVFVLPSFAEGLPVVIMEALARGKPVLTTYIAGIPELITDDESGWLIPAGSAELLAGKMESIIQLTPEELHEKGLHGQQLIATRHNPTREANKLLQHICGD